MRAEVRTDGRSVNPALAEVVGEGADLRLPELPVAVPVPTEATALSYYGLPAVKAPPWKWEVPAYLYVGGVAGGAAVLAGVTRLSPALRPLSVRSRRLALIAIPVGTGLLIADMGRPSRFLNMLRVFRPTSAINVGSWLLAVCGTSTGLAVVLPGRLADPPLAVAALTGPFVATYTGALLANTAIPLWSRANRSLPFLFGASALASTGWALLPTAGRAAEIRVLTRLAVAGQVGEIVGTVVLEQEARGRSLRSLKTGPIGWLWTASKVLGAAAVVTAVSTRTPRGRWLAAGLGTAAGIAMRFAVHEAGKRSARDPQAAFEPRKRGGEATGSG